MQQLVKGVVDKNTGYSPSSVRDFLAAPDNHEVKSQFLKHSKPQVEELLSNAVAFEAVVRQGLTARSTTGGGNGQALPEDMEPRIDYLSKYRETFDLGNSLTLRDGVNLASKLVRMKFDSRPGVNALRIKRMILGCFGSEPAASRFPENQTFNDWMKKRLEPSAKSMGEVVDAYVNTFPIDVLLGERESGRSLTVPPGEVVKRLLVSISATQTNEPDANAFIENWSDFSEKLASADPPHATAIYKLSPPEGMSAFLVTFDGPEHTVSAPPSPEVLKNLKDGPSGLSKARQMNAQIAALLLLHARINDVSPAKPMAIPQIIKTPEDQYAIGYQVLKRQAPDGKLLEDSLVKVRPNIKLTIPSLVQHLQTAMTKYDVMSICELMAKPEVVTKDIVSKEERTFRGSWFAIQEPPKVASAVLLR
jgi:hypothetical protein